MSPARSLQIPLCPALPPLLPQEPLSGTYTATCARTRPLHGTRRCGPTLTAGAWLTSEERLKGTITPGKLADLAVLDRDYFAVPDEEICGASRPR